MATVNANNGYGVNMLDRNFSNVDDIRLLASNTLKYHRHLWDDVPDYLSV